MDRSYGRERPFKRPFEERERNEGFYSRPVKRSSLYDPGEALASKPAPGETVFRLLCPEDKAGGVIGKSGSIIAQIRKDTGARISIHEAVPRCEERIIVITYLESKRLEDERNGNDSWVSPAQEALFRVHSRIYEGEALDQIVTARLIVPNGQIGALLGKGGSIMQRMRDDTKTQIRLLPPEQTPPCTGPGDEVLQISGKFGDVKKALRIVSTRLRDNPPRDRLKPPQAAGPFPSTLYNEPSYSSAYRSPLGHRPPDAVLPYRSPFNHRPPDAVLPYRDPIPDRLYEGVPDGERSVPFGRSQVPVTGFGNATYSNPTGPGTYGNVGKPSSVSEDLVYRVLCPDKKIGCVIGRGGSTIKRICEDIGVKIKVTDSVPGSDDRIIIISSNDVPDVRVSPAEQALLHVQSLIADSGPDRDGVITTRLLVPASHAGSLIGRGGSVVSEMRRSTGANIRILPREDLPRCALESDELVQIVGDIRVSREALIQISSRLRANLRNDAPLPAPIHSFGGNNDSFSTRTQIGYGSPCRSYISSSFYQGGNNYSSMSYQTSMSSPPQWSSKPKWDNGSIQPVNSQGPPVLGRFLGRH
eukprot:TRINITY_DN15286_c0_g1_i1.p1 TRINITY_DN15286_c0_g1~~TRINITY_DN15286_c0_g1_i1.p1  ORF type:complete len:586 (+),score=75.80 TRINITY_DN15286_c0_g1_i1:327-2084(+)